MIEQPLKVGEVPSYWTYKVDAFPGPVAVTRMAQLVDFDPRLNETARVVYRFLINWYHHGYGDALLSQRHVAAVMKQRAPEGAEVPSRSAVSRAIINLLESGWVARTVRGRGRNKSASRYVPVFNVLELAAIGKFPELAQQMGRFEDNDNWPTGRATSPTTGPVERAGSDETGPADGPKTPIPDPRTLDSQGSGIGNVSTPGGPGAEAPATGEGFERAWRAYGKHGNKVASRDAFAAIVAPDVEHIVERAASWAASAKPGQRRMPLEKWLAAEKYDEADRKPVAPRTAPPTTRPAAPVKKPAAPPRRVQIVRSEVELTAVGSIIRVGAADAVGQMDEISIDLENYDKPTQDAGQERFASLCHAVGLNTVEDAQELLGRPFLLTANGDFLPVPPEKKAA